MCGGNAKGSISVRMWQGMLSARVESVGITDVHHPQQRALGVASTTIGKNGITDATPTLGIITLLLSNTGDSLKETVWSTIGPFKGIGAGSRDCITLLLLFWGHTW